MTLYRFLAITMCHGKGCLMENKCVRFLNEPEKHQIYFVKSPIKKGNCNMFWPVGSKTSPQEKLRRTKKKIIKKIDKEKVKENPLEFLF